MNELSKAINEEMQRTAQYIQRFRMLYTYSMAESIYKNNRVIKRLKKKNERTSVYEM